MRSVHIFWLLVAYTTAQDFSEDTSDIENDPSVEVVIKYAQNISPYCPGYLDNDECIEYLKDVPAAELSSAVLEEREREIIEHPDEEAARQAQRNRLSTEAEEQGKTPNIGIPPQDLLKLCPPWLSYYDCVKWLWKIGKLGGKVSDWIPGQMDLNAERSGTLKLFEGEEEKEKRDVVSSDKHGAGGSEIRKGDDREEEKKEGGGVRVSMFGERVTAVALFAVMVGWMWL